MKRHKSFEDFRSAAIRKASWVIFFEQKKAGRVIDRADVIQDMWVWLLEPANDVKMRTWLSPDVRKFVNAVGALQHAARRALKPNDREMPEGIQRLDDNDEPVSIFDLEDSPRVRWVSSSGFWPSPIERKVAALGPPDADILQMSAEGFNATEIATELDLSPALVRQRRKRALDRLRQDFDNELAEAA